MFSLFYTGDGTDNIYVSSSGNDGAKCSSDVNPCKSLLKSFSFIDGVKYNIVILPESDTLGPETKQLYIDNNTTFDGSLSSSIIRIKICKLSGDDEGKSVFEIYNNDNKDVVFIRLCFELVDGNTAPDNNVFLVRNGILRMKSCLFTRSSYSYSSDLHNSLISLNSGNIYINDCTFEYMVIDSGDGGVFISDLTGDGEIIIDGDTLFNDCGCKNGSGGVINMILDENKKSKIEIGKENPVLFINNSACKGGAIYLKVPNEDSDYLLNNLVFNNNKATYGNNIFIEGFDLSVIANDINGNNSDLLNGDSYHKDIVGMVINNPDISDVIPLSSNFKPLLTKIIVEDGGSNDSVCGSESDPCGSLEVAFNYFLIINIKMY